MSRQRPTSCFMGTRLEALQALWRYAEVMAILTIPGSWVHQYCESQGLACHLGRKGMKEDTFQFLLQQSAQLVLSAGFPFVLPGTVLRSGPLFINSHPALLPAYKGYNAIKEAFQSQEEYMGVTVHFMIEEVDAGPHICQEKVWVKGMTLQEIYDLLFGVVEPMAITRAMEKLLQDSLLGG